MDKSVDSVYKRRKIWLIIVFLGFFALEISEYVALLQDENY